MTVRTDEPHPEDGQKHGESGFSLIEAIVVFAISALLLSVLTQLVIFTQSSNEKLRTHFQQGQDTRFLDLQVQALIDRIWVDPLYLAGSWQTSALDSASPSNNIQRLRRNRTELPIHGDAQSITFSAYDPFERGGDIIRVTLSLAKPDEREGARQYLRLTSDRYNVTWPVSLPSTASLAYQPLIGDLSPVWPPESYARTEFTSAFGHPPAPRSIHIVMPEDGDGSLHIFDVRL